MSASFSLLLGPLLLVAGGAILGGFVASPPAHRSPAGQRWAISWLLALAAGTVAFLAPQEAWATPTIASCLVMHAVLLATGVRGLIRQPVRRPLLAASLLLTLIIVMLSLTGDSATDLVVLSPLLGCIVLVSSDDLRRSTSRGVDDRGLKWSIAGYSLPLVLWPLALTVQFPAVHQLLLPWAACGVALGAHQISTLNRTQPTASNHVELWHRRLSSMVEQSPDYAFWCEPDLLLRYANPTLSKIVGWDLSTAQRATHLWSILSGRSQKQFEREAIPTLEAGQVWRGELRIDTSSTLQPVSQTVSAYFVPELDAKGRLVGIGGFLHDLTQRVASEAETQRRFGWQHLIATLSRDFLLEADDRLGDTLERGLERLGWFLGADHCWVTGTRELSGSHPAEVQWADEVCHGWSRAGSIPLRPVDLLSQIRGDAADRLRAGECVYVEDLAEESSQERILEHSRSELGSLIFLPLPSREHTCSLLILATQHEILELSERDFVDLRVLAYLFRDALLHARTAGMLAQRNLQLQQVQKVESVGMLAGGIAHDFNNLLTVIEGFTEDVLQHGSLDDASREDLLDVQEAARRGSHLTNQLLGFTRPQGLESARFDLNDVVDRMTSLLRRTLGTRVQLHAEIAEDLPAVAGDAHQIEQVVMNLVLNARDAMSGGGTILVRTRHDADDHRVGLEVSDNGSGISAEVQEKVFDPFFTTKAPGAGTGLGLATVQGIVAEAGGEIELSSELGEGTTFRIWLPAASAPSLTGIAGRDLARRPRRQRPTRSATPSGKIDVPN